MDHQFVDDRPQGIILETDPATIEWLKNMNKTGKNYRNFILAELSDTALLVKEGAQEMLQPELDDLISSHSFTPPLLEMQGKADK